MDTKAVELFAYMRTMKELEADLQAFKKGLKPSIYFSEVVGLCSNIDYKLLELENRHKLKFSLKGTQLIQKYVKEWPLFNGCLSYPIGGKDNYFAHYADPAKLRARLNLLNFTIGKFKEELENSEFFTQFNTGETELMTIHYIDTNYKFVINSAIGLEIKYLVSVPDFAKKDWRTVYHGNNFRILRSLMGETLKQGVVIAPTSLLAWFKSSAFDMGKFGQIQIAKNGVLISIAALVAQND